MELVNSLAANWGVAAVLSVIGLGLVGLILLGGVAVVVKDMFTPPEHNNNEPRI